MLWHAKHFRLLKSTLGCLHVVLSWPTSLQLLQSFLPSLVVGDGLLAPAAPPVAPGGGLTLPAAPKLPDAFQPRPLRGDHRKDLLHRGGLPELDYGLAKLLGCVSCAFRLDILRTHSLAVGQSRKSLVIISFRRTCGTIFLRILRRSSSSKALPPTAT